MKIIFLRRAQVAMEFMSLIMIGIVMMLALIGVFAILMNDSMTDKDFAKVKSLGFEIQRELILASEVHEGYSREFLVPEYVGKLSYSISNNNHLLVLRANNVDFPFPIPELNGTIVKGSNTVKNIGGAIFIE